ncbi:unnamed protein product [Withania somnifera]
MERDFMGLTTVKQEILEEPTYPAPPRSSAMQWSFPNNISAHPQYLSFKSAHEDKPKVGFDSLASTGLVTITTTESVDSSHRTYPGVTQNLITIVNHLPGAGAPVASPISGGPTGSAVVGTTDLRGAPKTSPGPTQLTIFYAGSVCVYDNVSPEKAQAIMLLAGNAPPVTPNATSTLSPVQAPIPKSSAIDSFVVNQCHNTSPTLASPISITSHGSSQSARVCSDTNGVTIIKSIGGLSSPSVKAEPSRFASPVGSFPSTLVQSAVPQARKASLARFLEKRKERVINASPYPSNSKQSPECSTPGFGRSLSMNSSGSCPSHLINLVK